MLILVPYVLPEQKMRKCTLVMVLTTLTSKNDSVKASILIYKQIRIHVLWIRIRNMHRCLWQLSLNKDMAVDLF